MSVPEEIRHLTEEVVASFNSGIGAAGLLIEKGLEILDGYQREEQAVRDSLRESLTSIGSLRRKDFDGVMARILTFQSEREAEIKRLIKGFLTRQRELAGRIKRALEAGILQEVERGKQELREMIDRTRGEIISLQREQELIRDTFAALEAQKKGLAVSEFKKVIQNLETKLMESPDVTATTAAG